MPPFGLIFLIASLILFIIAGIGVNAGRYNLIAFGLACLVLAMLLGGNVAY